MRHGLRFGADIVGTGHFVPERRVSNAEIAALADVSPDWIEARTGIRERRLLGDGETFSAMALEASRKALLAADMPPEALDLIIVGTFTHPMVTPSAACILQHDLGLSPKAIPAYDVAAACSGFLCGLTAALGHMQLGQVRNALVVGVEALSRVTDYRDPMTGILFADGAGAVVLSRTDDPERGLLHTVLGADGGGRELIQAHAGQTLRMNGPSVFKLAVRRMTETVETLLADVGESPASIKQLIAHQANRRIIEGFGEKLGLRPEQVFVNVDRYGNTSAASIPIALDECLAAGRIQRQDLVLLVAVGAGMTWGGAALRW